MEYPRNLQRVAMYLRKSRADLEAEARGEGETLAKHRRALSEIAKRYGYTVVDIYEEVVSGERIVDRPEVQKLLHAVQNGQYDAVLCMDIDRLGRGNMVDQGIIQDAFKSSGTLIITPRKVYDLQDELDEEWSEFEAFMARRELKIITRRLQRGRRLSAAEGKCISAKPPYGYRRGDDLKLYPDPDTAPVVRQIFLWSAEGDGHGKIARRLTEMGIPSPAGRKVWDRRMIQEILANPVYRGHIVWGRLKYQKGKNGYIRMRRDPSEWIVHKNAHEPLCDEETWERYQRALGRKRPRLPVVKELANPLATLIICAKCGRTMRRQKAYDRPYNSLLCKTIGCDARGARFEIVEAKVIESLRQILRDMEFEIQNSAPRKPNETRALLMRRREQVLREISDLETQRGNLHDLLERGIYDVDTFLERSRNVGERLEAAHAELEKIEAELERLQEEEDKQAELVPRLASVLDAYERAETAAEKNALLRSVVDRILYERHKDWNKPDQFKLEIHLKV